MKTEPLKSSMIKVNWNKEYNPDLLVEGLEKIRITDSSGNHSGFEGWIFDDYITVMYSSLVFPPKMPETDKRNLIHIAVRTVATRGRLSSKALLEELSRQTKAYFDKPKKKLILATSLSVRYFAALSRTSMHKLPIVMSARLPKNFNQQKALERPGGSYYFNLPVDYVAAQVTVQARSNFEATETALNALDLLRGIWNLFLNNSGATRNSFNRIEPVNQVVRGPVQTLHEFNGQPITDVFWYDSDYVEPLPCFDLQRKWEALQKFEQQIRRYLSKSPYQNAIEDAIRRYTIALDNRELQVAFLSLWGLLETLTNSERGSGDIAVKRASALWDQPEFNKIVLKHLKDYRNRAVHAGHRTDEIETYLHQLRRYVEGLLSFHVFNVQKFVSIEEASEFLDIPSDLTILQKRMGLLKKAIKFHKGSSTKDK